jgi:hypothetical protein
MRNTTQNHAKTRDTTAHLFQNMVQKKQKKTISKRNGKLSAGLVTGG